VEDGGEAKNTDKILVEKHLGQVHLEEQEGDGRKIDLRESEVDVTGSVSYPIAGFGFSDVET
jgi:hypothetical protein